MPYRKVVFASNEIYHILNRGVAQAPIFLSSIDYRRFLQLFDFYRYEDPHLSFSHYNRLSIEEKEKFMEKQKSKNLFLAEILAYCLMPNHFHFLLKQTGNKGIPTMLANCQNGYAKYFNIKHKRVGPLFQSMFKAIRIENDEQFLHVSRYIHLNPSTSYLVEIKDLASYPWSSYQHFINTNPNISLCKLEPVLSLGGGKEKYKKFVLSQADYQRKLNVIKHLILENP